MSLTVTVVNKDIMGSKRAHMVKYTGDSAYPSGGYPLTANAHGLQKIETLIIGNGNAGAFFPGWDEANSKLMIFEIDGSEIDTNEVDGKFFYALAIGF